LNALSERLTGVTAPSVTQKTCGRVERARRVGFAIDAKAYFLALAEALPRARRSVWILGWDIHSQVVLERGQRETQDLATLLDRLVRERPGLEVRILVWDHAVIYALEREFLPLYTFGFRTHRRVHFAQDDCHPVGASHHQKLVVIDDDLAFCGGLDLTIRRWDSPAHDPAARDRADPTGEPYGPFHDIQMAVQGSAAAALGDVARRRWRAATGEDVAPSGSVSSKWPLCLRVEAEEADIGIALTEPAYRGSEAVREIEAFYVEAVRSAKSTIYMENQYLTASCIADALEERLRSPEGPEVMIVGPRRASGWLEESTIGALRGQLIERLRTADAHDRLRLWYPRVGKQDVYVHAKVAVFDDRLLTVGSANLSNRSMALDTECNLVLEASGSEQVLEAARFLRFRLMAEHLGVESERLNAAVAEYGVTIPAVESLRGGDRSLEPMEVPELSELQRTLLREVDVVDPEGPIRPDAFVDETIPEDARSHSAGRYLRAGLLVGLVVMVAAAWKLTPLSELTIPEELKAWLAPVQRGWWAPLVTWGAFVLGGLVFFPITALIVYAVIAHGPWTGFAVALLGVLANASLTYGLGVLLGHRTIRRLAGSRLNRVSRRLARRSILAVVAVRVVPVAPFTLVNLIAGASHVRFRDYLLGTLVGMLPGIAAMTLLGDRLWSFVTEPSAPSLVTLVVVLALVVGVLVLLARRLTRATQ
jgi:phosphatidylserine/phosphatidylglycerophosphate/cardiolipin synthase-like enzyme/uncharacterized membrane protein YdjX (TVP38/TMEM64 family)